MTNPTDVPGQHGAATDKGNSPPQSGGGAFSRDERSELASLGAELLRRAEQSQPALEAAWNALMAKWGIHGQPVGIQRLRALIEQECGSKPEDNTFSRELIALREEPRL